VSGNKADGGSSKLGLRKLIPGTELRFRSGEELLKFLGSV